MERKVISLLLTFVAIFSLCEGKEPSSIAKIRKVFKNSKTQGFYFKAVGSEGSLESASKAVLKEFLKKHKFSKPEKYLKEWAIIFDQGDVPTGLEHDMKARMQMFKYPANIKAELYLDQLLKRNGVNDAEKAFKDVFANKDNNKFAMYTMGDGKKVHGVLVAAENKDKNAAFLLFMQSINSLEKEYYRNNSKEKSE